MKKEIFRIELPNDKKQVVEVPITLALKFNKKGSPWYGKIIGWWTNSPYYHVELIMFNKYWISANPEDNVYIRPLDPLKDSWDYVELKPLKVSREQLEKVVKYINLQNGKKYDFLGIVFSQVFKWSIGSDKKWFCSELATKILNMLGCELYFTQAPQNYSPGDMFNKVKEEAISYDYYDRLGLTINNVEHIVSAKLNSERNSNN